VRKINTPFLEFAIFIDPGIPAAKPNQLPDNTFSTKNKFTASVDPCETRAEVVESVNVLDTEAY
jgi:hypothetical protein